MAGPIKAKPTSPGDSSGIWGSVYLSLRAAAQPPYLLSSFLSTIYGLGGQQKMDSPKPPQALQVRALVVLLVEIIP